MLDKLLGDIVTETELIMAGDDEVPSDADIAALFNEITHKVRNG